METTPNEKSFELPPLKVPDPGAFIQVSELTKEFPIKGGLLSRQIASVKAVQGVSLSPQTNRSLAGRRP